MIYKKTQPKIDFGSFYNLVTPVKTFNSVTGMQYEVVQIDGSMMNFMRKSSGEHWKMDLNGVHQAYLELIDFKTVNFKPYVPRTRSPALGLLLHLGLLK